MMKWAMFFFIGLAVGLTAFVLKQSIEALIETRTDQVAKYLEEGEGGAAFFFNMIHSLGLVVIATGLVCLIFFFNFFFFFFFLLFFFFFFFFWLGRPHSTCCSWIWCSRSHGLLEWCTFTQDFQRSNCHYQILFCDFCCGFRFACWYAFSSLCVQLIDVWLTDFVTQQ